MMGTALCGFAIYANLPPPLDAAGGTAVFLNSTTAMVIGLLNVFALLIVLLTGRLRTMLDLWLSIAVLACLADTSLNVLSTSRFTVGWYLARVFSMFAPGILVCVLPDTGQRIACTIAERAREAVMRLGLAAPAPVGYVTVSAGCATTAHGDAIAPDEFVEAADAALYRAKGAGRNRIHL